MLAGLAASAMLGAKWVELENSVELIHQNRRPPPGIVVRGDVLFTDDAQTIRGMAVTTPARTTSA